MAYTESSGRDCHSMTSSITASVTFEISAGEAYVNNKDKVEVDIIIENGVGDCFAVEVKAAAILNAKGFAGLKRSQNIAGERFKLGILLYDGDHTTAFGDRLFAVPIGALWA